MLIYLCLLLKVHFNVECGHVVARELLLYVELGFSGQLWTLCERCFIVTIVYCMYNRMCSI